MLLFLIAAGGVGALCFIIIILLISRLYININSTYTKERKMVRIRIYLWRIRVFKKEIDLQGVAEGGGIPDIWQSGDFLDEVRVMQQSCQRLSADIGELKTFTALLLERMQFHEFSWQTSIGTGDAGTTGLAAGGVWMIKGIITGLIRNVSSVHCPLETAVVPQFQYKCFYSAADCILSIKIGQAMGVFIKNGRMYKDI